MSGSVIVGGARTPIGKLSGGLATLRAVDLGGYAIAEALRRAGVRPEEVEHVLMGQVLLAGQGQIPARQAAQRAGIPMTVPSTSVNKVCLSGLNTIHLADLMIRAGEAEIVVAGGMESMTNAPYLLAGARAGYRYGDGVLVDSMILDGLRCAFDDVAMGTATDLDNEAEGISRERQDAFAALSHERAAMAAKDGRLAEEIVPISVPQRRGDPIVIDADEGIRPGTSPEVLSRLPTAFRDGGTVTAGNASQISDGAAAVVVMSQAAATARGLSPLGEIVGYGQVAGPGTGLLHQPSGAIRAALERAGLAVGDIDLFEINEAFASVVLASIADLGIDAGSVNVNGGGIALGHPIGMSGTRIALSALYELRRRGGGLAAAALCGGGGQGDAILLRANA